MGLTPMMLQYLQIKEKCKDCILFYRIGDFYEMFFEDAKIASRELELVLTGKSCGMDERAPMCGIPYHAANSYIGKLIGKGFKVAIGEQMEDPSVAKGIVKRDIIKIITPGTYTDPAFLEEKKNNYIMSIYIEKNMAGLCIADISTGEFLCTICENNITTINDEISKFLPKEILLPEGINIKFKKNIEDKFQLSFTERTKDYFVKDGDKNLRLQFADYDDSIAPPIKYAASALLSYIIETQKLALSNISKIEIYNTVDYLTIDSNSRRNLELTETLRDKNKKGSLLWVLDNTTTSMGGRRLRKWIEQPLINKSRVEERLGAVEEFVLNVSLQQDIKEALQGIYDIERIAGKISSQSVNARELISLKSSLERIPYLKDLLKPCESSLIKTMREKIDTMQDVFQLIDSSIKDNPSTSLKDGDIIKDDYNEEISELRRAKTHGKEWLAALEVSEKEVTGIKSLKVGYNKVFGYYIEVTNANLLLIPEGRYIRKQTLTNGERFITPELKEMEDKILGAEEKLSSLEYEVFVTIRNSIEKEIERLKDTSKIISEIDALNSFAQAAIINNYCKPEINDKGTIKIEGGRHPVVEKMIPAGSFVSNDTYIDNEKEQLLLITGPNMAGKSTYMRQIALISLMAQMGSFVPANWANLSICDKIFTRIGASDDLSSGKSTFMVEMWEVSNILKNATRNSLVLLDEVGRGTSTYDGLSIAWAVIEYICKNHQMKCKTLFATHYHELIKLEGKVKGVKNYSIDVKKIDGEIVFLRKIVPKGTDESYGIEVAKLAGIPDAVVERAREILESLESTNKEVRVKETPKVSQINFMDLGKDKLIDEISSMDVLNMTPMEGFNKLYDIVNKARNME